MNISRILQKNHFKTALVLFSFLFIGLFFQATLADNQASEKQNMDENKAVWLDVRNTDEYTTDHIKGDLHIPIDQLLDDIGYYITDKSTPLKVYCQLGKRAQRATDELLANGYTDVECIGTIDQARERRGLLNQTFE